MDFWSRLIGGASPAPKKKATPNSPQHRLAQFKSTYNSLLIWHNGDGVSVDAFAAEKTRICLRRVAELLNDDTKGPTPHLCIAFSATSRLLVIVSRLASAFANDGITHEALGICGLLIDREEEAFLEDRGFAEVLPTFVRSILCAEPEPIDTDAESDMLEVLFGIASRIRLQPDLLRVWFVPQSHNDEGRNNEETFMSSIAKSRSEEFPLFYLLLSYVPAEGRAGEFARMGLLYLIESAAHSEELERWIVEGDMAALMASGLGALYSQLSRTLAFSYTDEESPTILTYSDNLLPRFAPNAEETTSPEYQLHLATFLSSLVFWQDLLGHCVSSDVKQTLLDHFQFLFLQQLLYPSLLESSDVDGGSSVAVLTYLRHILEAIDQTDLVDLTIQYLFGIQEPAPAIDPLARPTAIARRRKSESLLHHSTSGDRISPHLFNLADLILANLHSRSQQTLAATLTLLSVMFQRQHPQAMTLLLKTRNPKKTDKCRTLGGQEKEVDVMLSMVERIADGGSLDDAYDRYLQDERGLLEAHPCSLPLLMAPFSELQAATVSKHGHTPMKQHTLAVEDPVLKSLLSLVENFFLNDVETNLALTQVVIDLASCGYTKLEGWFLTDPDKYIYDDSQKSHTSQRGSSGTTADDDVSRVSTLHSTVTIARCEPSWSVDDVSPVCAALDRLVRQVEAFRHDIQDFSLLLSECRGTIEADEDVRPDPRMSEKENRKSTGSRSTSPTRAMPIPQIGSISERLRSERLSGSEPRNSSPRGRQLEPPSTPIVVGRLSHLRMSSSRSASETSSRAYSPSPLRQDSVASTPPKPPIVSARPRGRLLHRVNVVGKNVTAPRQAREVSGSEARSMRSESVGPEPTPMASGDVSLGHLLTNVVILQEFILELTALVEIRGSLFEEVRYA